MNKKFLAALLVFSTAWARADVKEALATINKGDAKAGLEQLQSLANAGDMSAQLTLATFYANAQFVPRDDKLASDWYARAAVAGNSYAQYRLGSRYEKGLGVTADLKVADS